MPTRAPAATLVVLAILLLASRTDAQPAPITPEIMAKVMAMAETARAKHQFR